MGEAWDPSSTLVFIKQSHQPRGQGRMNAVRAPLPSLVPCSGTAFAWTAFHYPGLWDNPGSISLYALRCQGLTYLDNLETLPSALWDLHLSRGSLEEVRNGKRPGHPGSISQQTDRMEDNQRT